LLRERLTSIPQDPVFLAGSVRLNCDPASRSPDDDIIQALRDVKLWKVFAAKGGLDAELTHDFLSKGQQQMFGFARALLNHGNIIVIDEASSR
jgi:ATP-binding cassette, subfamily C (CFTR/MRP), member 1